MKIAFGWIDVVVFLVLGFCAFRGYRRGLSGEILQVVGLLVSFILAFQFFDILAQLILHHMHISSKLANVLGYGIIFLCVYQFFFLLRLFVHKIMTVSFIAVIEKGGGLCAGILRGVCMLSIVFFLTGMFRIPQWTDHIVNNSCTGKYILYATPYIYNTVFMVWEGAKRFDKNKYFSQISSDVDTTPNKTPKRKFFWGK